MLSEDLSVLFSGPDAVDVTIGASSYKGLLDQPDELAAGGIVTSTEYVLIMKSEDLSGLQEYGELTVDGDNFTSRSPVMKMDDGRLSRVMLSKV